MRHIRHDICPLKSVFGSTFPEDWFMDTNTHQQLIALFIVVGL
jgi:hypothetical protein